MNINMTHNCCGVREITDLGSIRVGQKTFPDMSVGFYGDRPQRKTLAKLLEGHDWHGKPCAAFSWIGNATQEKKSAFLASEFRKLGFTIRVVKLNENPKTGHPLTMRIAIRAGNKKAA